MELPPEGHAPRLPSPGRALLLLGGVAFLYVLGGVPLQLLFGEPGLVMAQIAFLLLPALFFVRAGGYDPVRTLSLRRPARHQVLGGMILLAGATPIAWFLAWAQAFVIEVPTEMLEAMSALLVADDPLRLLWLLFMAALVPAVAEETLFRGPVLAGFGSRLPGWVAILLCGFVFGLFHLAPGTAFRFLPTAWLGVVLAWVVWESRSLFLGILLHFVNNAAILLLSVLPATREVAGDAEASPPVLLLPLALLLLYAGVRLMREGGGRGPGQDPPPSPRTRP